MMALFTMKICLAYYQLFRQWRDVTRICHIADIASLSLRNFEVMINYIYGHARMPLPQNDNIYGLKAQLHQKYQIISTKGNFW